MTRDELLNEITLCIDGDAAKQVLTEAGYTLAPLEPTETMISRGWYEAVKKSEPGEEIFHSDDLVATYKAMLAAQEAD